MHINVRDFLAESVGYSRAYKIAGEHPQLENVRLTSDIEGELTVARLETNVLVKGRLTTEIELECHRCLRTFNRPVAVSFRQIYAENPVDDELPIVDNEIDLAPLTEQEIILSLPIKILHSPDCTGVEGTESRYTNNDDTNRLKNQARIRKGK